MADAESIAGLAREFEGLGPQEVLALAAERFRGKLAFLSSLGAEDQALTDMIVRGGLDIPIATLDTGRLFPETYALLSLTERRYSTRFRVYSPEAADVEDYVRRRGIDGFRESQESRHECCAARKLGPLKRALAGLDAWVCGLRREQSVTRTGLETVSFDAANGLVKISPLADWDEKRLWDYIRDNRVPYNPLHDAGFPSIGCAPCTRAVRRIEDVRAGRWWWESADKRECGLHASSVRRA